MRTRATCQDALGLFLETLRECLIDLDATMALRGSGNLRLAHSLVRHQEISATQLCAHLHDSEVDEQYWGLFGKL